MTRKFTPAQLDEIEAAALAEITACVSPSSPDQLGRVRREWDAFLKAATPINVLALATDLRAADAKIERARVQAQQVLNKHSDGPYGIGAADQAYLTIKALGEEA